MTRHKDRVYLRWIGPAGRSGGEFRGQPVELVDWSDLRTAEVRFPDGSRTLAHWDHLTDAPFRLT